MECGRRDWRVCDSAVQLWFLASRLFFSCPQQVSFAAASPAIANRQLQSCLDPKGSGMKNAGHHAVPAEAVRGGSDSDPSLAIQQGATNIFCATQQAWT